MNRKKRKYFILGLLVMVVASGVCATGCDMMQGDSKALPKISLDDDRYVLAGDAKSGYQVTIPAGRPRVPQVVCDGAEVYQAYFADGEDTATAKVIAGNKAYSITFFKDEAMGFHLQYDDRYEYKWGITPTSYSSSNPEVAEVNEAGVITVTAVSDEPVVITGGDGINEETLHIDKTVAAPLNVYLLTGQSNAAYFFAVPEKAPQTRQGTAYQYDQINREKEIHSLNRADGTMDIGNIEASFCKEMYALTGEKTLVINVGVSGQKLETFIPTEGESYKLIESSWEVVQQIFSEIEFQQRFEPRVKSYLWAQGESDDWLNVDKYIYEYQKLHKLLVSDAYYGFEYGFIIMVTPKFFRPCDAQEQLAQANEDLIMATRETLRFSPEGGQMEADNLHYAQEGDNILGKAVAETVARVYREGTGFLPEGEGGN